ncbi:MAG: hypothetical protein Q7S10_02070 [bacterium]|nr:hypothetical protein [bacterium]
MADTKENLSSESRSDIIQRFKDHFKTNVSQYGLRYEEHFPVVKKLLPNNFNGILDKGEISNAIRAQQQKISTMKNNPAQYNKYAEMKIENGVLAFLEDMDTLY